MRKDYTGQKFNRLTIIRPTEQKRRKYVIWEALCDCGIITYVIPVRAASGNIKSCGCIRSITDYTGRKINKLTFVSKSDKRRGKSKHILWQLSCECGNTHYARATDVVSGRVPSCGCDTSNQRSLAGLKSRRYDPHISSARTIWRSGYKEDGMDFETFYSLSQQLCYYCGREPHRTMNVCKHKSRRGKYSSIQLQRGDFTYNGLDRVDNTKGHTPDNVVPCCKNCNLAKSDMSYDDFIKHIDRMYEHIHRSEPTLAAAIA